MKLKITVFVIILLSSFGCCRYEKCAGANQIAEIRFYNFSMQELDLVTIVSYPRGNHSVIEHSYALPNQQVDKGDYIRLGLFQNFIQDPESDYKIVIGETQQEFWITDLDYEEVKCGGGFCQQKFTTLESIKVDGVEQALADTSLIITNP